MHVLLHPGPNLALRPRSQEARYQPARSTIPHFLGRSLALPDHPPLVRLHFGWKDILLVSNCCRWRPWVRRSITLVVDVELHHWYVSLPSQISQLTYSQTPTPTWPPPQSQPSSSHPSSSQLHSRTLESSCSSTCPPNGP